MQITDEHERQTIETYDKNAELWAQDHGMEDSFRLLELFKASLPSGSVLEVGAGSGYDGKMLSDAGYVYTGTDASKGMVELASKKYPELSFSQLSVYNLKRVK